MSRASISLLDDMSICLDVRANIRSIFLHASPSVLSHVLLSKGYAARLGKSNSVAPLSTH